jgi:UDP-2,4-diacetamido-2,4,6-trideoxy-beta-L-altropyranose hydrolase
MHTVVIRTDASSTIGSGQVMRCLTLAAALRTREMTVRFVSREHEGHLCDLIEERGFTVARLPRPKSGTTVENTPSHASWLGETWKNDAEQTRVAIEQLGHKADWLVVDHYGLDERWEQALRPAVHHHQSPSDDVGVATCGTSSDGD